MQNAAKEYLNSDIKRIRVSFDEQTKRSDLLKNMKTSWKENIVKNGTKELKFPDEGLKNLFLNIKKTVKEVLEKDPLKAKYLDINEKLTKEIFEELQETQSKTGARVDFNKIQYEQSAKYSGTNLKHDKPLQGCDNKKKTGKIQEEEEEEFITIAYF